MYIGKIVKSDSHINYVCQIYGPREVELEPNPADYAFGRFVRIAVRAPQPAQHAAQVSASLARCSAPLTSAIGVIYDTILLNPAFGQLAPRLSNASQVEVFSPDYLTEKAVLVYVMVLGMLERRTLADDRPEMLSITHGVPLLSLELGSEVETMREEEVRAFHYFSDAAEEPPCLHTGYIPHVIAQRNSLLPQVTLCIIDQLERLFPAQLMQLAIIKRNFAWQLKVKPTG